VHTGGKLAGKQLCQEGPGSPHGQQTDRETAVGPCSKGVQQPPGLRQEKHRQQMKGGDPPLRSALVRHSRRAGSGAGVPSRRGMWAYWGMASKGPRRWLRDLNIGHMRRG